MSRFVFSLTASNDVLQQGLIPVEVKVHAEARSLDEDWSGKSSRSERRKLQNRLNQRSYRRRKAAEKQAFQEVYGFASPDFDQNGNELANLPGLKSKTNYLTRNSTNDGSLDSLPCLPQVKSVAFGTRNDDQLPVEALNLVPASWCRELENSLASLDLADAIEQSTADEACSKPSGPVKFEEAFLAHPHASKVYPLLADHLLSLMYYNVFRALVRNVESLSLDMELMHTDSYPSPFISNNVNSIKDLSSIPAHFHPTQIQQTIPHHPCFDIFPDTALRDNGILHCAQLPHGKLCLTLAGRETWYEHDLLKRNGMVIWADPDKVESWEVTEGFARHWPWLVKGAWRLQNSTNAWRRLRGEAATSFA